MLDTGVRFGLFFFFTSSALKNRKQAGPLEQRIKGLGRAFRAGSAGAHFPRKLAPSSPTFESRETVRELPCHPYSILELKVQNQWTDLEKPWFSLNLTLNDLFKRKPRAHAKAAPSPNRRGKALRLRLKSSRRKPLKCWSAEAERPSPSHS